MRLKLILASLAFCALAGSVALAASDNADFINKRNLVLSMINQSYTGPENITVSASEDELRNNWLPYANALLEKESVTKGSSFKDVWLNSDGSVTVIGNIGQNLKDLTKIPFFSTVEVSFKPTAVDGSLKIQVTRIKLGWFPVSVSLANKFVSRWADLNNYKIKLEKFKLTSLTVTDTDLTISGYYYRGSRTVTFQCQDNKYIKAEFHSGAQKQAAAGQMPKPTGSVEVHLSDGREFYVPQTISADGGRYANSDESIIFWNKGNTLHFYDHNLEKGFVNCTTK